MNEEIIINTQLALFFGQPILKPEDLWQSLNSKMENIFDQTPIILPVPNDPNLYTVPVVQMRSSKDIYSCNISRNRVDLFVAGLGRQKFKDIKEDLLDKIVNYYTFFSNTTNVKRIGFVVKFFIEDEKPDESITKLFNTEFIKLHGGTSREGYLRYISRDDIDGFDINNLTAIEKFSTSIVGVGENIKGVLITRDFNTIPEKNYNKELNAVKLKNFIEKSEERFKLEDIQKILWPK